ncbi:MAG: S-methyl-5'-thioadenosine phosphorylase [Proteobacteria bacterium]|nr:MAG: S-methyl-5'-thioadenosine phosphorylase [Pseudomonadota bacterium]PIE17976.1 MAG: S-methyl-5'-thioadenosine phosphorylase [Pseudomonadota bacterium]
MATKQIIGVLGGSGLYEIEGLSNTERVAVETPFGAPSDAYLCGDLDDKRLLFLPRHGRRHTLLPSEVNYRANIYGFKKLGAQWLISISAVGSMREAIEPGHVVIADQFIDLTKRRESSFFGAGVVGHVQFADPIDPDLAKLCADAAEEEGATVHRGGTYVCIEGPQFSTRAESSVYRSWGVSVIGMTNMPEAKLAREAGIGYATCAMATDYDCWYEGHDDVSVETVIKTLKQNVEMARRIIANAARRMPAALTCRFADAGKQAVFMDPAAMNPETRAKLTLLLD